MLCASWPHISLDPVTADTHDGNSENITLKAGLNFVQKYDYRNTDTWSICYD